MANIQAKGVPPLPLSNAIMRQRQCLCLCQCQGQGQGQGQGPILPLPVANDSGIARVRSHCLPVNVAVPAATDSASGSVTDMRSLYYRQDHQSNSLGVQGLR